MLNGKELGDAIRRAIQLKMDAGELSHKKDVAEHFGVKPPSIHDWIKKGSISKDKLPELFRYFSSVAGPEHWGLKDSEWPVGLSKQRYSNPDQGAAKNLEEPAVDAFAVAMFALPCTKCGKVSHKSFIELESHGDIACSCGALVHIADYYGKAQLETILKSFGGAGFSLRKR